MNKTKRSISLAARALLSSILILALAASCSFPLWDAAMETVESNYNSLYEGTQKATFIEDFELDLSANDISFTELYNDIGGELERDGDVLYSVTLKSNADSFYASVSDWDNLPLSDYISENIYISNIYKYTGMSENTEGKYKFVDKNTFEGEGFEFSDFAICFYDEGNDAIYYYTFNL